MGILLNTFTLSILCVVAAKLDSNEDPVPVTKEYRFHRRPSHGISDPGSPWITGPNNKKYQFHVGRQSWLAAREHCLGQNSDLVTISTQKELEWILAHYSPQFPNLKDRLVQIGLMIDMQQGTREWHWVNKSPLNQDILSWISGEPFDHAGGRERCALLRVNEESIDDVDCDLPGNVDTMYRFVCERTHEEHVKHEEVNNPLWKKLQDILDFFGISGGQTTNKGDDKNVTRPGEDEEDYWEAMKTNETTTTASKLVANKVEKEEVISSTATIANAAQSEDIEGSGVEADNEIIKPIVFPPAQAKAAKTLDSTLVSDELILPETLEKNNEKETNESTTTEEAKTTNSPDVVILETASIETTRTTKPDPLDKPKKPAMEIIYIDALQKNMEKLENIVSAVEKMIDPLEGLAAPPPSKTKLDEGIVKKENNNEKQEGEIETLKHTFEIESTNETINENDAALSFNNNATDADNEINEKKEGNEKDTVDAMEKDFDEAEHEAQAHPNVNSGDLVVTPEHKENIELCENENENENEKVEEKMEEGDRRVKIHTFLKTLHRFLNRASAKDLKELVEESKKNGTSLLDRLNESISNAAETQIDKMETLKQKINESIGSDDESVVKQQQPENENKRENDISTTIIPAVIKGHDLVQISSVENNNNTNEENNNSESTIAAVVNEPEILSTPVTTTSENSTTDDKVDEKATTNVVVDESESTTISNEKSENPSNDDDKVGAEILSGNATLDDEGSIEKNNSSGNSVEKEESKAIFENKNEGESSNLNATNGSTNPSESGENKKDEEEEGHEVTFTIYLPTAKNDKNASEEIKESKEKTHDVKEEPKSRADRFPSKKEDDSVFPTPRFDLLKPEELKQIPTDISKAIKKEANDIGKIYDDFNKKIDTSALLKRIEESEKRRLKGLEPLPIANVEPKVTLAPSHDEVEQKAMRELESLFEDLGRNFQQIVQG